MSQNLNLLQRVNINMSVHPNVKKVMKTMKINNLLTSFGKQNKYLLCNNISSITTFPTLSIGGEIVKKKEIVMSPVLL